MAEAAKKERAKPQPRGLTVEIPMEHTTRALQLAQGAGLSTKAEVEAALSEFIVERYLEPFLTHLASLTIARTQQLLGSPAVASTADTIDLMAALKASLAAGKKSDLTPDGGIPLVPAKEGA